MNILAIDTSGPAASCGVMSGGRLVHAAFMNHGLTHSETIMPAVNEALEASGLRCADVDVFAAVAGPGSYTGVRIGVCAAKGLAHAVGKPCAQIHALEALALNFSYFAGTVCPILDARRGQVYCAAFDVRSGRPVRLLEDAACPLEEFLGRLPAEGPLVFVGDGVAPFGERVQALLGARALLAPQNLSALRAEAACLLATDSARWIAPEALRPIYLRAPQAERERAERLRREGRA